MVVRPIGFPSRYIRLLYKGPGSCVTLGNFRLNIRREVDFSELRGLIVHSEYSLHSWGIPRFIPGRGRAPSSLDQTPVFVVPLLFVKMIAMKGTLLWFSDKEPTLSGSTYTKVRTQSSSNRICVENVTRPRYNPTVTVVTSEKYL